MIKITLFAALVAAASAGLIPTAPAATSSSSFTQKTVSHRFAAPTLSYATPVTYAAAPAASSHSSFTQHTGSVAYAAAPVAHYAAAPVAHYAAAPVAHYAAPVVTKTLLAAPVHKTVVAESYAPPQYDFEYAVHDPNTGDVKEQKESRKDDVVRGVYSLIEPDGTRRVVEYTADDHNGFNAVVHREPAQHPVAVKTVAPVVTKAVVATPVYKPVVNYPAPVKYVGAPVDAPATHFSYNTPSFAFHY